MADYYLERGEPLPPTLRYRAENDPALAAQLGIADAAGAQNGGGENTYAKRRAKQLQLEEKQKAQYEGGVDQLMADFEKYGTPSISRQRALKTEGGVYDSPEEQKWRMVNDPENFKAALLRQKGELSGQTNPSNIYEGKGEHGERFFTNRPGEPGIPRDLKPYAGGGNFSTVSGTMADESKRKKLEDIDKLLEETDAAKKSPGVVARELAQQGPRYEAIARGGAGYTGARDMLRDEAAMGLVGHQAAARIEADMRERAKVYDAVTDPKLLSDMFIPATPRDAAKLQKHLAGKGTPLTPGAGPGDAERSAMERGDAVENAMTSAANGGPGVGGMGGEYARPLSATGQRMQREAAIRRHEQALLPADPLGRMGMARLPSDRDRDIADTEEVLRRLGVPF